MALIIPPFSFAHCTTTFTGTPVATLPGVNFTVNANDTDGTPVSVLSALTHDVHYMMIGFHSITGTAILSHTLVDILVDPAGGTSWANFIDDLVCGWTSQQSGDGGAMDCFYFFPIYVKAGSSIGVQGRTAHTSNLTTPRINMWVYGNPSKPEQWWCGQKVESLGLNPSTSTGTSVTTGVSSAYGSWTDIGTSTAHYGAVQYQVNGLAAVTTLDDVFYIQLGYDGTQFPGQTTGGVRSVASEQVARSFGVMPTWCDVPSGTTWQVRMASDSTPAADWHVAIYGVY